MSEVDIVEVETINPPIEVVERGPQGPAGISIPTEVVTDFPLEPVEGTLYIKVS